MKIPEGDLGISVSQKTEGSVFHASQAASSKWLIGQKSSAKASTSRRSNALRHRGLSARSSVYTVQKKCKLFLVNLRIYSVLAVFTGIFYCPMI